MTGLFNLGARIRLLGAMVVLWSLGLVLVSELRAGVLDSVDARAARLAEGAPAATPTGSLTALEQYIGRDDGAFKWELVKSVRVESPVAGWWHALRMTSQLWRSKDEVSDPEWTHWVSIWVPDRPVSDRPMLFIGGGRRREEAPCTPPRELSMLTPAGAIVVTIDNVPNQPLRLGSDSTDRVEDGLVARTWVRAMETGDPTWIARFPMVKAAVRAMDTAEQFFAKHPQERAVINGKPLGADFRPGAYLVAGGSKRGWTTWLTAAVDQRVGALAPLVIDVLDLPAQMRHHHAAYGGWSPALNDYVETGLTDRFLASETQPDPLLDALLAHDDPLHWLSRVGAKPKLLINASGDEFFLPDSSQFYEDRLPKPWRLRYVPNSGHNLKDSTAVADLVAFYRAWALNQEIPQLTWTSARAKDKGELVVTIESSIRPETARLWSVDTKSDRDFRVTETGKAWTSRDLRPSGDGMARYEVELSAPSNGFRASFVEVVYPSSEGQPPLTFTTSVFVLPDHLPHARK